MSTVEKDAQVLVKRSWKLPVVYVAASILLLVFGVSTYGDVTIRLNDKSQSYSIPDIVTSGAPIVWVLVALTILVTACAVIVTVRRIDVPSWARAVGMSVVGVSTILGFLLYAGSDSAGAVTLTSTLVSTVAISTPLIFGALSGVISERVGVVNIAIEGDLLVGAFAGIMAASYFQTAYAGLVAAPLAGALLGSLLALFSVKYGVDQIIIGVVLNVLALGLTTFLYGTIMKANQGALNTNRYSLTDIKIPRVEWGVGMGHKQINGGLMPGGRLRMEKLSSLVSVGKLDLSKLITHKFNGFENVEKALMLMKDKPADLIKPVVII